VTCSGAHEFTAIEAHCLAEFASVGFHLGLLTALPFGQAAWGEMRFLAARRIAPNSSLAACHVSLVTSLSDALRCWPVSLMAGAWGSDGLALGYNNQLNPSDDRQQAKATENKLL